MTLASSVSLSSVGREPAGEAQWAYAQWACRVHAVGMQGRRVHAVALVHGEYLFSAESKAQPGKLPGSYGVYQGGHCGHDRVRFGLWPVL